MRILPYVFVADDAFPLRTDVMKPFPQTDLDSRTKIIYSYRLSRARLIVENAFGILNNFVCCTRNLCFAYSLDEFIAQFISPDRVCYTENFEDDVIMSGLTTRESTLEPQQRTTQNRAPKTANQIRFELMSYFVSEGKVPWQDSFILLYKKHPVFDNEIVNVFFVFRCKFPNWNINACNFLTFYPSI